MDNSTYDPNQPRDPLAPAVPTPSPGTAFGEQHEPPVAGAGLDVPTPPPGQSYTQQPVGQQPYPPQQYQQPYGGPPAAPPPEERKGFNWLACCGISCGLGVVLLIVVVFAFVKFFKPLIQAGMQLGTVAEHVKATDSPKTGVDSVSPEDLAANPNNYKDKWISVTGVVTDDPGSPVDKMRQQQPSLQDSSAYFIKPNIVVLDVKHDKPVGAQGDTIMAVGQPVLFDFEQMLGPIASREIEKENKLGDLKQIIFLITNDVKVVNKGGEADPGSQPTDKDEKERET